MGERSNVVAQLVDPLIAEMAAVVRASQLDPGTFFPTDFTDVAGSTDRFFQVPPNSLVFCRLPTAAASPSPSGPKDITAFAYMRQNGTKPRFWTGTPTTSGCSGSWRRQSRTRRW